MRPSVPFLALALAAAAVTAPLHGRALGAQTPAPATTQPPGSVPVAPQDSMRRGTASDTMRHGGLGPRPAGGAAGDSALVARLDSVDAAARTGLAEMPIPTAVAIVEAVGTRLRASTRPALRSIARDLGALRSELEAPAIDGRRVGVILRRLGPKVSTVARTQSGPVRATLQRIGAQLTTTGSQMVAAATTG